MILTHESSKYKNQNRNHEPGLVEEDLFFHAQIPFADFSRPTA